MAEAHQSPPTVGSTALAALRRRAHAEAFSWGGGNAGARGSMTAAQVLDAVGRTQAVFAREGMARGDGVAVLAGNDVDSWICAVAAWCSGLRLTYLHPRGSLADHLHQLEDAQVRMLVADAAAFGPRAAELHATAAFDRLVTFRPSDETAAAVALSEAREQVGAHRPLDVGAPEDVLWLNYTGGTTGRPKGVAYRHRSVLNHARAILADFELPNRPRYLAVAPITHVAGTKILPVLHRGGSVHLQNGFRPEVVLETIARERISMTLLVPTMVYDLLDAPGLDAADLSSLELALYGASPMALTRLAEAHTRIGHVFAQLYGQSECYPISYLPRGEHVAEDPDVLATCGFPVHGTSVSLRDDAGDEVAPGEAGEICVRALTAMDSYWRRDELTAETLAGGWLHTGDIGRIDERGLLAIVDRKKDMVVTGGFNVFPREVEDALTRHPEVSAAAVYGVPDERWGEAVAATVVLRDEGAASADDLRAWVRDLKGAVQAPKTVRFARELPLTPVGKVDKKALRL
ncbi:AMP-binding protein [Microbacterium sp. NPDC089320]|uniref:AMP-binding protein n=1 Tax=Microbacterium sp. NPDC089320 TaxID=3155182 RepID=UPI0034476790